MRAILLKRGEDKSADYTLEFSMRTVGVATKTMPHEGLKGGNLYHEDQPVVTREAMPR